MNTHTKPAWRAVTSDPMRASIERMREDLRAAIQAELTRNAQQATTIAESMRVMIESEAQHG